MIKYKTKTRWVDLSNLPQFKFKHETHIQWDESIGCDVPFQYDEVCGNIHIIKYRQESTKQNRHRAMLTITIDKYVQEPIEVRSDFITNCQLYNLVKNKIINIAPHLVQYLENPDDAYKYTYQSNQKIWMRCPICGHRELKNISNVYRYGFICNCTSDGISIPNKIMFNILRQLNIDFINEANKSYGFSWMENYLYDFYFILNNQPIIVEMDGFFHQFQEENDKIKTQLAENNGCKLIRIDCIYRNVDAVDYIKSNILDSELSHLIPLNNIDWAACKEEVSNSILIESCRLWEDCDMDIASIAERFRLDRHTIMRYLKRGKEINLCPSYNNHEARVRGCLKFTKPIACIENNQVTHVFKNKKDLINKSMSCFNVQCTEEGIHAVCNGHQKTHRGLIFKYITKEEYEQHKMITDKEKI